MPRTPVPLLAVALLALAPTTTPRPAAAAWPTDPLVNVPLCTAAGGQYTPTITSDGAGGAIVTWRDVRSGEDDIYAQRISAAGTVQWAVDGVAICTAIRTQGEATITSDGAGGAIVTWTDYRSNNNDIYAQRISADGTGQWTADGVALCAATGTQTHPTIISDGAGGAIVTWQDYRSGSYNDIYAQRISAAGVVQWTNNGVAVCTAALDQWDPTIASDGAGGAIVVWRSGYGYDIYAQRISSDGTVQWTSNGVIICVAGNTQYSPIVIPDGAGGAVVAWWDGRSGGSDIYAQRIAADSMVHWTADGVALCTASGIQNFLSITSDGAGGAIVAWWDGRSGNSDIYAQRIAEDGTVQWTADGVVLCTAADWQLYPAITPDGAGGAIVTWFDYRSGSSYDIYAQRVSAAGAVQWTADGVALCAATGTQQDPTIVTDGAGGAIVTWRDSRDDDGSSTQTDIYAQRVLADGQLGGEAVSAPGEVSVTFALDPVRPNPSRGGALMVQFTLPSETAASLELLDVAGRRIAVREVGSLGAGRHSLELGEGRRLAPGLYLVCLRQGTNVRVARAVVLK